MIKKAASYTLIFYLLLTAWQFLFKPEINWLENLGLTAFVFLAYLFIEWVSKPYQYKKKEK